MDQYVNEPNELTCLMDVAEPGPIPIAFVEFLNLPEGRVFNKVQCRKGGVPRQVVEEGQPVEMKATYSPFLQLYQISGWVRRMYPENRCRTTGILNEHDYPLMLDEDQPMNLADNLVKHGHNPALEIIDGEEYQTLKFFVDFNKIYDPDPKTSMFKLFRTETETRNIFRLRIQLLFAQQCPTDIFDSPTFRCRTKPKNDSRRTQPHFSPQPQPSTPPDLDPESPPAITSLQVVTDSLVARTARIDDLVLGSISTTGAISTTNADIAYHLKIKDDAINEELEEGDVVGFFTDEEDGGTYIKLLRSSDMDTAVHAGVVSRSWYLDANKPVDNNYETDTVCVVGIVKVKVIGSVENGERIYSSIDRPGKAIPQSHLPVGSFLRKKHVLLGTAMERKRPKILDDEHLVKCFVCIVLDVSRADVLEEVELFYEESEKLTQDSIKLASRKTWRALKCCFVTTALFCLLLAFLLYQVFVPGSMFRYWLCRRGSVNGDLWVSVTPYADITETIDVHGIRFEFDRLEDKVSDHFTKNFKVGKGNHSAYYFLNLDRCAYFGDKGPVRNYLSGKHKDIGGGKVLSINHNCNTVYWFGKDPHKKPELGEQWYPYKSARNLTCSPEPPYDPPPV